MGALMEKQSISEFKKFIEMQCEQIQHDVGSEQEKVFDWINKNGKDYRERFEKSLCKNCTCWESCGYNLLTKCKFYAEDISMYSGRRDILKRAYEVGLLVKSSYIKTKHGIDEWPFSIQSSIHIEHKGTDSELVWFISDFNGKNTLYIIYPGTQTLKDVFTDALFFRSRNPAYANNSKVRNHWGFLNRGYLPIRKMKFELINDNINDIEVICESGHSLGGAVSEISCVDTHYNFIRKDGSGIFARKGGSLELIGFAAPGSGNKQFYESLHGRLSQYIRVESPWWKDIVTGVPPQYAIARKRVIEPTIETTCKHGIENYVADLVRLIVEEKHIDILSEIKGLKFASK